MNSEIYAEFAMNRMNKYLSYPVEVSCSIWTVDDKKAQKEVKQRGILFLIYTLFVPAIF